MTKINPLIGCDPEFFLYDEKAKQSISAHGLVEGDKKNPKKINNGAVQLDGTAIEFNIDPASTRFEFEYRVNSVLDQIRAKIPDHIKFDFSPAVNYEASYFKDKIPEQAKELGCEPDWNANSTEKEPQPRPKRSKNYQTLVTGAGHIHVGWTQKMDPMDDSHFYDARTVIKELYYIFSRVAQVYDKDNLRRTLYGNGPVFRPKPYGVENRQPSNAWVKYPKLWGWVYDVHKEVFIQMTEGKRPGPAVANEYDSVYYGYHHRTPQTPEKAASTALAKANLPDFPEGWSKEVYNG